MTLLGHTLSSSGFIQDFLDHNVDQCWYMSGEAHE